MSFLPTKIQPTNKSPPLFPLLPFYLPPRMDMCLAFPFLHSQFISSRFSSLHSSPARTAPQPSRSFSASCVSARQVSRTLIFSSSTLLLAMTRTTLPSPHRIGKKNWGVYIVVFFSGPLHRSRERGDMLSPSHYFERWRNWSGENLPNNRVTIERRILSYLKAPSTPRYLRLCFPKIVYELIVGKGKGFSPQRSG